MLLSSFKFLLLFFIFLYPPFRQGFRMHQTHIRYTQMMKIIPDIIEQIIMLKLQIVM